MTVTVDRFHTILDRVGSIVTYHTEDGGVPCPCRTEEGFRDPTYHRANPEATPCNEQGFIAVVTEFVVRAAIQPAVTGLTRAAQRSNDLLGAIQSDDRIGVFPCEWDGNTLDFSNFSDAGEDFIIYDGKRYMVVAADKLADIDGQTSHHWECGLRLVKSSRPTDG